MSPLVLDRKRSGDYTANVLVLRGLISRGFSPAYVQQQRGHASIQQTVDTYGSWLPVRVRGAVDALGDALIRDGGHPMDTLEGLGAAQAL